MPAIPSWLLEPLGDQFAALLPDRPVDDPAHPRGCHRRWIPGRIVFGKLVQVLRSGCSYASIAGCACSATTIRDRRGGCIGKAPGGGRCAGRSPVDRGKQGMKRSCLTGGYGIPLDRVLAPASRHDSPLLAPTLDKLDQPGSLPGDVRVHLDAGYDSQVTGDELARRKMTGQIARPGRAGAAVRGTGPAGSWRVGPGRRRPGRRRHGPGPAGTDPAPPTGQAREALERAVIGAAADLLSGPGGLASFLRTRELGARLGGPSLPLDVGYSDDVPAAVRRAVTLCATGHCEWPGGCRQPA